MFPSKVSSSDDPQTARVSASPLEVKVILKCSSTKEISCGTLALSSLPPHSLLHIKQQIEKTFSIPTSTQVVAYESNVLSDTDVLESVHFRSGDTLHVTFEAKAECTEVQNLISWLQVLIASFQSHLPTISDKLPHEALGMTLLNAAIQSGFLENLRKDLFMPWNSDVKQMNKTYFLQNGGLPLILQLHSLLLGQDWQSIPIALQRLERGCLNSLYHLASTYKFRRLMIRKGCIESCVRSLLRERLNPQRRYGTILLDLIASAMGTLCNMCEIPEAHLRIASNPDVLKQFICVAHWPSYSCWCAQLAVNAFVCFAHCSEVHKYLASPEVISGLLDTYEVHKEREVDLPNVLLLKYFTVIFLAQLILVSPRLIPESLYYRIHGYMARFFQGSTHEAVAEQEVNSGCFWSVFLPYVKLPYIPTPFLDKCTTSDSIANTPLMKLQLLSILTALFGLQCMLFNKESREGLLKENLMEYIICLPWIVPSELTTIAEGAVTSLSAHDQLQPPRLSVLAKAKLAKMHFGLERMFHLHSVQELYSEIKC